MRTLAASLLALSLVAAGCPGGDENPPPAGGSFGGSGGNDSGGAGPSRGGAGGGSGGFPGGVGGGSGGGGSEAAGGAGGSGATGGSGGGGGDQRDGSAVDARPAGDNLDGGNIGDAGGIPGHEWVIPCQPSWTRTQCCMHYCTCMMMNCSAQAPANCVSTCSAPGNNWNLKCRVEQCFEALNPKYPMDKGSHCGHAVEKPPKCQGIIP